MSIVPDTDKKHVVYSKEDNSLDDRMDAIGEKLAEKQKIDNKTKTSTIVEGVDGKQYVKTTYYEPLPENKPTAKDLRKELELGLDGESI